MLTNRGIEANQDKCKAVLEMKSLTCLKEVQQLIGRIAALTRFLPASAKKSLPLFRALKRKEKFEWTHKCESAFSDLKEVLGNPPVLTKPDLGKCYIYTSL